MSNRPAGGARSKRWEKAPYDFYREPKWVVEQLFDAMEFGPKDNPDLIFDPCCGTGNILDVAKKRGYPTLGGDIVDRHCVHPFQRGNILINQPIPKRRMDKGLSVICNPPYSYEPDIGEKIVRRVLDRVPIHRAAFLVPIAFLASETRWRFFTHDFRPSHVFICSQRPTMPPGHMIEEMVNPYEGGMADYIWVIWTFPHRYKTETQWLKPTTK